MEKGSNEGDFAMATASNDGLIKLWRLTRKGGRGSGEEFSAECVGSKDCGCRITCMAVHKVPEVKQEIKRTKEEEQDDDQEDEGPSKKGGGKKRKRRRQD